MLLYSTTTSERASKSQGGNEFLEINILCGDKNDQTVLAKLKAIILKGDGYNVFQLYCGETLISECVVKTKGKKKKGKKISLQQDLLEIAKLEKKLSDNNEWNNQQ